MLRMILFMKTMSVGKTMSLAVRRMIAVLMNQLLKLMSMMLLAVSKKVKMNLPMQMVVLTFSTWMCHSSLMSNASATYCSNSFPCECKKSETAPHEEGRRLASAGASALD